MIQIQVGECGNQIGMNHWAKLLDEHKIDKDGKFIGSEDEKQFKQYAEFHFRKSRLEKRYIPRAILVDLDCNAIDDIKQSSFGRFFKPENMIYPKKDYGTQTLWAKGHYTDGAELVDTVLNAVRIEIEACDNFQGFNFVHSLCGGTGSGLGTLLISKLREEYPDRIFLTNTVAPNFHPVRYYHVYNSILSFHHLTENTDITMLYDNNALGNICSNVLNMKNYKVDDVNSLISRSMLAQTACERFPSQLKLNLRKYAINSVPFPRLHFFIPSLSFTHKGLNDIFHHLIQMDKSFNLARVDLKHGKTLTFASIFRGQELPIKDIDQQLLELQNKKSRYFVDWMGYNCLTGVCQVPEKNFRVSGAFFNNTSAVQDILKMISEKFTVLFKRKSFLHWYTGEGMDEMEFTEAESNVNDLVSEYQQYQDATADVEENDDSNETDANKNDTDANEN